MVIIIFWIFVKVHAWSCVSRVFANIFLRLKIFPQQTYKICCEHTVDMCVQKSPLFWYISLKSVFSSHQEPGLWWKWRDKLKWEGGEQSGVRTTETDLWLILIRCQSVPGTNITTWLTHHRHCLCAVLRTFPCPVNISYFHLYLRQSWHLKLVQNLCVKLVRCAAGGCHVLL